MDTKKLSAILSDHALWRKGEGGTRANLAGTYLADATLAGTYLAGANIAHANLTGANLSGANLVNANLAHANLSGANLVGTYLADANLAGTYLADANLADANLVGVNFTNSYLTRADLTGANLTGANLTGTFLTRADLKGANLIGARSAGYGLQSVPLDVYGLPWPVRIGDVHMEIGCQSHLLSDWEGFLDGEIAEMDAKALVPWRIWKPILLALAKAKNQLYTPDRLSPPPATARLGGGSDVGVPHRLLQSPSRMIGARK